MKENAASYFNGNNPPQSILCFLTGGSSGRSEVAATLLGKTSVLFISTCTSQSIARWKMEGKVIFASFSFCLLTSFLYPRVDIQYLLARLSVSWKWQNSKSYPQHPAKKSLEIGSNMKSWALWEQSSPLPVSIAGVLSFSIESLGALQTLPATMGSSYSL